MSLRILSLAVVASAFANPLDKAARDTCNPCSPSDATGTNPPSVGPDLGSLYLNVLASVKDIHFKRRWSDAVEARADSFCCAETLDCVNVQNLNIPMCYDKFTTNFAFPDKSFGSLTTGNYTQVGAQVNLFTGQYSKDGTEGNIYSNNPAAKPNTATLSIPPQFTASGVGSAIPATAIAGSVTATAQTSGQTTAATSGQSSGGTAASTTSQPTGSSGSGSSNSEAPTSSHSGGAAAQGMPLPCTSIAVSIFAALMGIIYGL